MTRRRPWPNAAIEARDNCAQEIAESLSWLVFLVENQGDISGENAMQMLGISINRLQNALRWLESVGAQTVPPPPRKYRLLGDRPKKF